MADAVAEEVGAGPIKRVVLLLDNPGFHTRPSLAVPDGPRLVDLPPWSPELQAAETLWTLVDESVVDRFIPSLDALETIVSERCRHVITCQADISSRTRFAWWPENPPRVDTAESV